MTSNPAAPVPNSELLACTLWKCYRNAVQGIGDGSVTWWTLQPIEREWWLRAADNFRNALVAHPDLIRVTSPANGESGARACPTCGQPMVYTPRDGYWCDLCPICTCVSDGPLVHAPDCTWATRVIPPGKGLEI